MLKIISLNIEGQEHLDIQEKFFINQSPDILCLQEVFENTYLYLKNKLNFNGIFAPMWKRPFLKNKKRSYAVMGIALLTNCKIEKTKAYYYNGNSKRIFDFIPGVTSQDKVSRAIVVTHLKYKGNNYTVGTTHFTWSKKGMVSFQQKSNVNSLLKIINELPGIVFCGDFNAPRGGYIFKKISSKYKDNIPRKYTTSIDKNFHYAGNVNLMVDGLFSTKEYLITNTKLVSGVSDHYAIIANIYSHKKGSCNK